LETTVTKFAGCIDKFELDLLESITIGLNVNSLTKSQDPFADTDGAALENEEVVLNNTIANEATHWIDGFLGEIEFSGSGSGEVLLLSNTVDLLVALGTMMVTVLTSTRDSELDSTWMPSTDTSDLAETFVSLARKTSGSPTSGDTFESLTLGDTDNVDHLVLLKDVLNGNCFLEQAVAKVEFLSNGSSVDLDLHNVCFLLRQMGQLSDLSVSNDSDDVGFSLETLELGIDAASFEDWVVFKRIPGEGLLL